MINENFNLNINQIVLHPLAASSLFSSSVHFSLFVAFGLFLKYTYGYHSANSLSKVIQQSTQLSSYIYIGQQTTMTYSMRCKAKTNVFTRKYKKPRAKRNIYTSVKAIYKVSRYFILLSMLQKDINKQSTICVCQSI